MYVIPLYYIIQPRIFHAATVIHWALWQPPRYAGSWPSCPSCSSRRRAWDCQWPGKQTMPHPLTLQSGLWESWWTVEELRDKRRKELNAQKWELIPWPRGHCTNSTRGKKIPLLTRPHFTVSDWTQWLVLWWLHVVLTSWVSSRGHVEGLPVGHK